MTIAFHRIFKTGLLATAATGMMVGAMAVAPANASYLMHMQSVPVSMILADADGKTKIQSGAESFIGSMAQRALDFLSNKQETQAQKTESFRHLLEDNYDMDTIAKFTLGRYWRTATESQKHEFMKLFRKYVVEVYSKRFSDYKGQKFSVTGSRQDSDTDTIVSSKILTTDGGEPVEENKEEKEH